MDMFARFRKRKRGFLSASVTQGDLALSVCIGVRRVYTPVCVCMFVSRLYCVLVTHLSVSIYAVSVSCTCLYLYLHLSVCLSATCLPICLVLPGADSLTSVLGKGSHSWKVVVQGL